MEEKREWRFNLSRMTAHDLYLIGHHLVDRMHGIHTAYDKNEAIKLIQKFSVSGGMKFHWREPDFQNMVEQFTRAVEAQLRK